MTSFIGVRKGKTIQRGLFMNFADCKDEVEGFAGAEYATFRSLEQASQYLQCTTSEEAKKLADASVIAEAAAEMPAGSLVSEAPAPAPAPAPARATRSGAPSPPSPTAAAPIAPAANPNANANANPNTSSRRRLPTQATGNMKDLPPDSRLLAPVTAPDFAALPGAPATADVLPFMSSPHAATTLPPKPRATKIAVVSKASKKAEAKKMAAIRKGGVFPKAPKIKVSLAPKGNLREPLEYPPEPLWWELYFKLHDVKKKCGNLDLVKHATTVREVFKGAAAGISVALLLKWCNFQRICYKNLNEEARKENLKVTRLSELGFDWLTFDAEEASDPATESLIRINHEFYGAVAPEAYVEPDPKNPLHNLPTQDSKRDQRWQQQFDQLNMLKEDTGHFDIDPTTPEGKELRKWTLSQRHMYKAFIEKKIDVTRKGCFNQEKIDKLINIGFDLSADAHSEPPFKWYRMWHTLKEYHEKHNTFEIKPPNESTEETNKEELGGLHFLQRWLVTQRSEYRKWRDGKPFSFNAEKARQMEAIGFDANYEPHDARIQQYKTFVEENPGRKIPQNHPLYSWLRRTKGQIRRLDTGVTNRSTIFTPEQLEELKDLLAVQATKARSPFDSQEENHKWEAYFEELNRYKTEHGDCLVKMTFPTTDFQRWIRNVRVWYNQLEDGKDRPAAHRELTPIRMKRLMEIGFAFRQKPKYWTFEQRLKELQEYKQQHGTTRVPTCTPGGLGNFVSSSRNEWRKFSAGEISKFDQKKFDALKELGFEFQIGPRRSKDIVTKNWDERFQDLLAYKEENGDTVVPQHYKGYDNLGKWVQSQRKNYKKLKQGLSSALTPVKALKLSEIGFVWDAMYKIRKRERDTSDNDEVHHRSRRRLSNKRARTQKEDYSSSDDAEDPRRRFWY